MNISLAAPFAGLSVDERMSDAESMTAPKELIQASLSWLDLK